MQSTDTHKDKLGRISIKFRELRYNATTPRYITWFHNSCSTDRQQRGAEHCGSADTLPAEWLMLHHALIMIHETYETSSAKHWSRSLIIRPHVILHNGYVFLVFWDRVQMCRSPGKRWPLCLKALWPLSLWQAVYQSAFLSVLFSTRVLVDSWNVISRVHVPIQSPLLAKHGCDLILPPSRGCIRGALCVLWPADIPQCISHQQPETMAEEKINNWQLTSSKYYCCWVTECNFTREVSTVV